MGHVRVPANGSLDGHKTDLTDRLEADDPPSWFHTRKTGVRGSPVTAEQWRTDRRDAAEEAAQSRESIEDRIEQNREKLQQTYPRSRRERMEKRLTLTIEEVKPITDLVEYKVVSPPASISEGLDVSREDASKHTGYRKDTLHPREYVVQIHVGVDGDVVDIVIARDFHI